MLLVVKVRLKSPWLGEMKPDHRNVRRFRRQGPHLHVHATHWRETYQLAARQLGLNPNPEAFQPPAFLLPASLHLYKRTYSQVEVEWFEAMRGGTILAWDCLLREDLPRAPSLEEFRRTLVVVGRHFGLSPFGNKFGYGRFELIEALPATGLPDDLSAAA
jgi:hypothetical protein